jgi:trimethylguanosine synthase
VFDLHADEARYWQQRHLIFSKYDEGIWLTDDAWFEVTPEPVAKYGFKAMPLA